MHIIWKSAVVKRGQVRNISCNVLAAGCSRHVERYKKRHKNKKPLNHLRFNGLIFILAERRGFEPRLGLTLNTLSRRAT
jgi:hypothetical protein